ncbi:MAG: carboxyl-terminal processing protease CtpA [Microcoleaceae cyanobacterium]
MYKPIIQIAFVLWFALAQLLGGPTTPALALTEEQNLVGETWRIINQAYIDDSFNGQNWWFVRKRALRQPLRDRSETYEAIETLLKSLDDPFTRLLRPEQYRSLQMSTSGELTGVGLQIALDGETGQLTVIAPIDGSPASDAGIVPRDRIVKIDGVPTDQLTLDEAAEQMRGPAGSTVILTVQHSDTPEPEEIKLVRDRISLNPVLADLRITSGQVPIGYIRLSQFSANATEEVARAITQLQQQGANGYILDLRNNPGGLLQAGVEIAQEWLDEGTVVYTVNRQGFLGSFEAAGTALTQAPLVVLVNGGTASASEILAGALQDNYRAVLVGEKTFGKGLIQSLFDLSDGAGLAVTVAKYETPAHHDINKLGIQPDYVVPATSLKLTEVGTANDLQYQKAVELLNSGMVLADADAR